LSVFQLECDGLGSGRLGLHRFPLVLQGFPEAEVCLVQIQTVKEQAESAPMSDIFFNFVNEPTYLVFEWVRSGGLGDVPRLIASTGYGRTPPSRLASAHHRDLAGPRSASRRELRHLCGSERMVGISD